MNLFFKTSIVVIALALISQPAFATHFKVDPAHSSVGFQVRHLVSRVDGNFRTFEATYTFDKDKLASFNLQAVAQVDSIDTNNKKRDEHLKSPDFFDAKKFPTISFKSTHLEKQSDTQYKVTGDFTMHGVTKSVTFDVEHLGEAKDPMGTVRGGATATASVNRKDFGIVWNKQLDAGGVMLGEDVKITLNLELIEDKPEAKKAK